MKMSQTLNMKKNYFTLNMFSVLTQRYTSVPHIYSLYKIHIVSIPLSRLFIHKVNYVPNSSKILA